MSYYRRLPLDVRVALWVDEHPRFMRSFGLATVATTIAGSLVALSWLVPQ